MKRVLLALVLSACSDDADPDTAAHDVMACSVASGHPSNIQCERACNIGATEDGSACMEASSPNQSGTFTCVTTFEDRGVRGCCAQVDNDEPVVFWECP